MTELSLMSCIERTTVSWYQSKIPSHRYKRTVIVSKNDGRILEDFLVLYPETSEAKIPCVIKAVIWSLANSANACREASMKKGNFYAKIQPT